MPMPNKSEDGYKFGQDRDAPTIASIEQKKAELLAAGIRLDMPFIQKLVSEEVQLAESLRILETWIPHLETLKKIVWASC